MSEASNPRKSTTAFDQASTLVLILELSGKSWRVAANAPGVSRRPLRTVATRDIGAVLKTIERWKDEAHKAGCEVGRVVVGYEAGLDGFWIARALMAHGVECHASGQRFGRASGSARQN
jgi:transposase